MSTKILVVDDDPEILSMTELFLGKRGYEVFKAPNGLLALEEIKRQRPDIILCDVLMPEMDGYELYKELKKNPLTADIPVLIITAREKMEDSFKSLGVDGFISKPFPPEDLVNEIEHQILVSQNRTKIDEQGETGPKKKILAVGNEKIVLENMEHQAQKSGYIIKTARTGSDAIAETVKYLPDIIFVDVLLSDMKAGELIDILRRLPQFDNKPIVGYCYYSTDNLGDAKVRQDILRIDEVSKRVLSCGADHYMGRYTHQVFVKTAIEFLDKKRGKDIRTEV